MDDWLKLALLGGAAATGGGLLAAPAAAGAAGTGASLASMGGAQGLMAGGAPGLASMGGAAGLVPGAAGAAGLSVPAGALPVGTLGAASAASGGLLAQGMPYLKGAGNVLGAASAAKNLTTDPQMQAPSAGLGGGQPVRLGQALTANQRRLRGLLG